MSRWVAFLADRDRERTEHRAEMASEFLKAHHEWLVAWFGG